MKGPNYNSFWKVQDGQAVHYQGYTEEQFKDDD